MQAELSSLNKSNQVPNDMVIEEVKNESIASLNDSANFKILIANDEHI